MNRRTFLSYVAALATVGYSSPAHALFGLDIGDGDSSDSSGFNLGSLWDAGSNIIDSFEDITPEQEYYIGRSVSAVILSKYKPFNSPAITRYLTVLGNTVAMASSRPQTFGGYSFQMLDSEEVNALSAPGGYVFVTRGLMRCCNSEDALAAVLAHEVGHVALQHGLQAIQESRLTSGLSVIAKGSAELAGGDLGAVTQAFGGAITDVTTTMIESGYSRSQEYEADEAALATLKRVGYDPQAMVETLQTMREKFTEESSGFAKTHPSPEDRIEEAQDIIGEYAPPTIPDVRTNRFIQATSGV